MHNIKLAGVLRFISIVIISLTVFLYIMLNTLLDDIILEGSDTQPRKEYEYIESTAGTSIPGFTYNLESLFPKQPVPVITTTKIVTESIPPAAPPSLKFVGMIETNDKIIYSFRNMDTNRLLLLEEGVEMAGITLLAAGGTGYTFKKNEITFQVGK